MAGTSGAQRQAAYRARRAEAGDNGERRINTWVSTAAALALARLARRYAVTQRGTVKRNILGADKVVAEKRQPNPQYRSEYLGR